ncbi:hypothetical protein HanXRQr2_Chr01g0044731 [Helianthus annuus]|uniref:Uncharacterized protein n=1 Tax=Helianthus annuus TaxID=4232 RepID=A0A9K3K088_HELAN|nr:hypothetical protein HanXRQr2_Chr01g0044731 [Helianthus annuus]
MMCMYLNISPKPNVYPIHLTTYSYWNHIQPLRLIPAMFRAPTFSHLRKFGSFISREVDASGKHERPPSLEDASLRSLNSPPGPITPATQPSTTDSDIQEKSSPLPPHAVVTESSCPLIPEKPITKRPSDPHELLLQRKQNDKGGQTIRTEISKMEEQIHQMQETLGGRRKNNKIESGSKGIFRLLRSKI